MPQQTKSLKTLDVSLRASTLLQDVAQSATTVIPSLRSIGGLSQISCPIEAPVEQEHDPFFDFDSRYEDWRPELVKPELQSGPFYMAKYNDRNSEFTFLGTRHIGHDPAQTKYKAFFGELEQKIADANPAILILEPIMPLDLGGYSPCPQAVGIALLSRNEVIKRRNEGEYAAWIAMNRGIPFTSGEPSREMILGAIRRHSTRFGISETDYFNFEVFRCIASLRNNRPIRRKYDQCMDNPNYSRITFNQIKTWYRSKTNTDIEAIDPDRLYEQTVPNRTLGKINEIAATTTEIRNARLRSLVFYNLQLRKRVMAIYGTGHLFQNHSVFQNRISKQRWF